MGIVIVGWTGESVDTVIEPDIGPDDVGRILATTLYLLPLSSDFSNDADTFSEASSLVITNGFEACSIVMLLSLDCPTLASPKYMLCGEAAMPFRICKVISTDGFRRELVTPTTRSQLMPKGQVSGKVRVTFDPLRTAVPIIGSFTEPL